MKTQEGTPVLDLAFLDSLRQLDGPDSPGFAAGIVSEFLETFDKRVAALRAAAEIGALDEFGRNAHTLKSSAAQLGGARMSAACQRLEQLAREGGPGPEAEWLPQLGREIEALRAALRAEGFP